MKTVAPNDHLEAAARLMLVERIGAEMPLEPLGATAPGETAARWRYADGGGEIGLISSVTNAFCGTCNRARISTEGKLFTCLFADEGHDLRALLRGGASDGELAAAMGGIWGARADRYSEIRSTLTPELRQARQKIEIYRARVAEGVFERLRALRVAFESAVDQPQHFAVGAERAQAGDILGIEQALRLGELQRGPVSPIAIVEAAIADLLNERVDVDAEHAPASWSLDAQRMQQVISNLVDNVLQAAADERVEVEVRTSASACVFEVRDRGPGVPDDQRELIFQPFHTTRIRGTGLGLAVSRRIVELHGGTIEVEQNPGGGALFRVTIPKEQR